ncbi:MAG: glycosyltransferase [Planctomycetota bacterium]|nr:glycosyltransferase [Planctomycetota bacterium]
MSFPVFIAQNYQSQYSLLGAMATQLAEAFTRAGCPVRPIEEVRSGQGIAMFLNFPSDVGALGPAADPKSGLALVQLLVDHPLAIQTASMDALARLPHYRLVLPCVDSLHLLRLRWPGLRHAHLLHAVPPQALADPQRIESSHVMTAEHGGRDIDVCVAGTIHASAELDALWRGLPNNLRPGLQDMVDLLLASPHTTFEQAADVVMGPRGMFTGDWPLLSTLWRIVTMTVNTRRRVAIAKSLQGLRVSVFGPPAWREVCTGTIQYAGDVEYARVSEPLCRSRVSIAWGPTQFAHSFSERVLLSLAAGCATVADDRLLQRTHFRVAQPGGATDGAQVAVFPAQDPSQCRAWVDHLLTRRELCGRWGAAGRELIASRHLWDHRLQGLASVAADASSQHSA